MKLIIDRNKWLRGEGSKNSYLLRSADQKMCCLGFYSLQCGLKPSDIANKRTPINAPTDESAWLFLSSKYATHFASPKDYSQDCSNLMRDNDSEFLDEKEREACIIRFFAKNGVEVEVIN
jgi:hypothetical protein